MKIAVIGSGAWGTALALHFCKEHDTVLLTKNQATASKLLYDRENRKYLPHQIFPPQLKVTSLTDKNSLDEISIAIIATPTAAIRETLNQLKKLENLPYLLASKGFEKESCLLPHQVASEVHPHNRHVGLFAGPTFANELATGLPSALCISTKNLEWGKVMAKALSNNVLRIYANDDPIGVGVGSAVKNVIAIACGFSDGIYAGSNARAALITRGLAEMIRLALALGGKDKTLRGLGGLGDLILTCTGDLSRNRHVGFKLAQGENLSTILCELGHVAEGINTLQWVLKIAKQYQVDMPISQTIQAVINGQIKAQDTVDLLMNRLPKLEES